MSNNLLYFSKTRINLCKSPGNPISTSKNSRDFIYNSRTSSLCSPPKQNWPSVEFLVFMISSSRFVLVLSKTETCSINRHIGNENSNKREKETSPMCASLLDFNLFTNKGKNYENFFLLLFNSQNFINRGNCERWDWVRWRNFCPELVGFAATQRTSSCQIWSLASQSVLRFSRKA